MQLMMKKQKLFHTFQVCQAWWCKILRNENLNNSGFNNLLSLNISSNILYLGSTVAFGEFSLQPALLLGWVFPEQKILAFCILSLKSFFPYRLWLFVDPLDYSLEIVYLMVRNTFLGKTKWLQNSLYFKKADWNPLIIRPLLCKRLCNCLPAYNTRQSTNVMFNLIVNCFRWGGKYREWVISGCWWTYLGACLSPCWSYHGYPH